MLSKKVLNPLKSQFDSAAKDKPIWLAVFGGFAGLTKGKEIEMARWVKKGHTGQIGFPLNVY